VRRLVLALLAALLLAGCGEERGQGEGSASLWVTRDRGEHVVLTADVPAGLTAMQALQREVDVETLFGGRFVQSINGVEGSLSSQRDWFYFVNGYEGDRSAAEYELHDGDVLWWDFREWGEQMRAPVVVGAFPEPFLHGYEGERRPAVVRYVPGAADSARALGRMLRADSVASLTTPVPEDANVFYVTEGSRPALRATFCSGAGEPGDPVCFRLVGDADALVESPECVRFRYEVVPWP
jgi:hypothetical protein